MAIANARQIRLADQAAQAGEVLMIKSLQDMCRIRRSFSPIEIDDYELQTPGSSSPMLLSEFLDYRARLLVIHNMGDACAHCAVYADGLNGVLPHLESIAEVLLVAPMSPEALGEFAASRSWRFALASTLGTSLARTWASKARQANHCRASTSSSAPASASSSRPDTFSIPETTSARFGRC